MEAIAVDTVHGSDAKAPATDVADTFVAVMRSFGRAKARFLAMAEHDVEWSAQILLRQLAHEGPMRASELAGCTQSDPSTVSRQVAALVKDGHIERRADPDDGRASILVLTPKADSVLAAHDEQRAEYFAAMLAGWSEADLSRFAELLRRFSGDFEKSNANLMTERIAAARQRSAEGK